MRLVRALPSSWTANAPRERGASPREYAVREAWALLRGQLQEQERKMLDNFGRLVIIRGGADGGSKAMGAVPGECCGEKQRRRRSGGGREAGYNGSVRRVSYGFRLLDIYG